MSKRMPHEVSAEDSAPPPLDRAATGALDLRHALAASRQHLGAALQQIDALLEQRSGLEQQLIRLAQAVAQAHRRAHHDELTGLPNRALLLDRFKQAVALGARQQKQVALLFLDLDGFKSINDALGHAAGDRLLQQVAARLAACIRTSDTACRYGGDEFVILLPELDGQQSAVSTAEKIRAHLAKPYCVGTTVITVTTSIGIALYPVDGKECGDLIRVSDLKMYHDKSRAPAPPRILEPALHTYIAIQAGSTIMPTRTRRPTPAEQKFERVQEEAFSNEGAPPTLPTSPAANADDGGVTAGEGQHCRSSGA